MENLGFTNELGQTEPDTKITLGKKSDVYLSEVDLGKEDSTSNLIVKKDKWNKDIEFLLSCIALSVGLGNVWRFPFSALENGGGAFVIPYIIVLLLVGKPLYYMELVMGQFSSRGCIKVYDMSPVARGIGVGQLISTCIVTTYYATIMALTVRYFIASFASPLPWSQCKEVWNETCIDSKLKSQQTFLLNSTTKAYSSAELYFVKDILKEKDSIDDGIGYPNWELVLCLIFAWICISLILIKGVKSSGKASYFLAVFPYIIMFILLIRSMTLEGALDGMLYFIKPQWDKIFEAKVWYAAVCQVFYSLAVCFGGIIMYSSYNRFSQNIYKDVNVITAIDTMTSLLAGFIIFGILGHLGHVMGVKDLREVIKGNVALAFIAYPETIAKIDFFPEFFSMIFFIMLFVLGIGSNIGMASCIMTCIRDRFPQWACWKVVLGIAIVGFSVGCIYTTPGGQYILSFLDFYGASFVAFILAIAELITVGWIYGVNRFCRDIQFMLGKNTSCYYRICWKIVTPLLMTLILIYTIITWKNITYQDYEYSSGLHAFGWCISLFGLLQLPIWAIYAIVTQKEKDLWSKVKSAFRPNSQWGPNDHNLLKKYQDYMHFGISSEGDSDSNLGKPSGFFKKVKTTLFG